LRVRRALLYKGKNCMLTWMETAVAVVALVPPVMAEEVEDAQKEVVVCLFAASQELDDRVSDVASIAPAVADACRQESRRYYQALRKTINAPIDETGMAAFEEKKDLDRARMVLLKRRAADRAQR
jgi:hypothetical protein